MENILRDVQEYPSPFPILVEYQSQTLSEDYDTR